MEIFNNIPDLLSQFVILLLFSLLIGIEQRKLHNEKLNKFSIFGTDRTFTFIGILGFILYISEPDHFTLFISGALILGILFAVYYSKKIEIYKSFGFTNIIVGIITYSLGPIIITQPKWFSILVVVSILILVELKSFFQKFTTMLNNNEFISLAKFLIIAGIILPIIPDETVIPYVNISPYKLWITVVAVSSISYFSYLLQKFVFRKSGLLISGILGGLYSSTATTVVLSRKSKEQKDSANNSNFGTAIILASSMMYLRIFILMLIFNFELGVSVLPHFIVLILFSLIVSAAIYFPKKNNAADQELAMEEDNPLELKIAFLFSFLFILFGLITNYTLTYFGESGLDVLSFIVGFTDIDPFLLNLFQGRFDIGLHVISKATFQAIISNNILKILYAVFLADKGTSKIVIIGLGLITLLNAVILFFI